MSVDNLEKLQTLSQSGNGEASAQIGNFYYDIFEDKFFNYSNYDDSNGMLEAAQKALYFYKLAVEQGYDKAEYDAGCLLLERDEYDDGFLYLENFFRKYSEKDCFLENKVFGSWECVNDDEIVAIRKDGKIFYFFGRNSSNKVFGCITAPSTFERILHCYQIVANRNEEKNEYISNLGWILNSVCEDNKAIEIIEKLTANKEEWIKLACSFGEFYLYLGDNCKAIEWLRFGDKHGSAKCAEILGNYFSGYYDDFGATIVQTATAYYEKSFNRGNLNAAFSLATSYIRTNNIAYKDKVISLLLKAAEKDTKAYYYLGRYCLATEDSERAYKYLKLANETDDLESKIAFALCLRDGIGHQQDIEGAIEILSKIIQDHTNRFRVSDIDLLGETATELGLIYYEDRYSHKSDIRAYEFFRIGHRYENIKSEYLMGTILSNIKSDPLSIKEGQELIEKAISKGFNPSCISVVPSQSTMFEVLEKQLLFYQQQLIEKDIVIKHQQNQISTMTNKIANVVKETNTIIKNIDSKIDSMSLEIKNIKEEYANQLDGVDESLHIYEEKMTEISNKIVGVSQLSNDFNSPTIENELISIFTEENWVKLSNESKRFLISSRIVFSALSETNNDGNLDFSPVCLMICKAVENEMKKRFYYNFLIFLDNKYNKRYADYHTALTSYNSYTQKTELRKDQQITLGDIPFILCASFTKTKQDYYEDNKSQILEYCNNCVFNNSIDAQYLDDLSAKIGKIKNDYRNPACHSTPVSKVTAIACSEYVLDGTKFLVNFIANCK